MAWPCVTRACCIARFGNQLDKSDISVPLMYTKFSEATDGAQMSQQQHAHQQPPRPGSATIETQPSLVNGYYGGQPRLTREGSVMQQDYKRWKYTPEPSCKPKIEYQPSEAPLERETQYKKDYRSWPIPRQGDHPWIPKPIPGPSVPTHSSEDKKKDVTGINLPPPEKKTSKAEPTDSLEPKATKEKASVAFNVAPEILISVVDEKKATQKDETLMVTQHPKKALKAKETVSSLQNQVNGGKPAGSSYRNEFKPWTDVRPMRSLRTRSLYKPPEEKVSHETSYNTTFKGECNQPATGDNKLTERRRIRSLYSEPHKESSKVEKPSVQTSRPKKTPTSHKPVKKAKEKQIVSGRASKKKTSETTPTTKPEDKEKSKEINNKLAEAKE
ncbi:microtubule-associated protein 6 isoform X2 [Pelobates fuscus]|uniref:microtubule-associated protein 6 isoform X2 n=1 Tax=Pelobates fuscus TaxID=191477 RepID=UPI002FE488C1